MAFCSKINYDNAFVNRVKCLWKVICVQKTVYWISDVFLGTSFKWDLNPRQFELFRTILKKVLKEPQEKVDNFASTNSNIIIEGLF